MVSKRREEYEKNIVYIFAKRLADRLWVIVRTWEAFDRDETGDSLANSADILKLHVAQAVGGGDIAQSLAAAKNARSALFETRHWMKKAFRKELLSENEADELLIIIEKIGPDINRIIDILSARVRK